MDRTTSNVSISQILHVPDSYLTIICEGTSGLKDMDIISKPLVGNDLQIVLELESTKTMPDLDDNAIMYSFSRYLVATIWVTGEEKSGRIMLHCWVFRSIK